MTSDYTLLVQLAAALEHFVTAVFELVICVLAAWALYLLRQHLKP